MGFCLTSEAENVGAKIFAAPTRKYSLRFLLSKCNPPAGGTGATDVGRGMCLLKIAGQTPLKFRNRLSGVVGNNDAVAAPTLCHAVDFVSVHQRQSGQEKCMATVLDCACEDPAFSSASQNAVRKVRKNIANASTHLSYLAGNGHGQDPHDRWRNWYKWLGEARTALKRAASRSGRCTKQVAAEVIGQIRNLEVQLQKFSQLPRGGG